MEESIPTKDYLKRFFLYIFIGFVSVVGINYYVDPGQIFSKDSFERKIAKEVILGYNVKGVTHCDERILQKFYISMFLNPKDVIALGSSRSMQIRQNLFPGKSFFNHSVSGASLEDFYAIYELLDSKNLLPSTIVLGIDPWLFNRFNGQTGWHSLKWEFYQQSQKLGCSSELQQQKLDRHATKYLELVSLEYFFASLDALTNNKKQNFITPTKYRFSDVNGILKDGSRIFEIEYRRRNRNQIIEDILDFANTEPIYSLGNFKTIDTECKIAFEKLVLEMIKNGINVILYLPPYHPIVMRKLKQNRKYQTVFKVERYLNSFAVKHDIVLIGSYEIENIPEILGERENFFVDGMHPKEILVEKIFGKLKNEKDSIEN